MKSIQEEQYEYDNFIVKLANKSREIQEDFDKLSQNNKHRVENELRKILAARGLAGFFEHVNRQK
ncbi:MAG: hypothetical protein K2H53_00200 [Clostridia bacterium]|nr:hypothetical protein [Clostridia bacterium]